MEFRKEQLLLYAVTDDAWTGEFTLLEQIEQALKGGVTLLQLREKEMDEEAFVEEAVKVKALCQRYNVPLIINDNLEVAMKSKADGVHVGMEDMDVANIRERVGKDFIIGATAKTVEQAKAAEEKGADYLGVGAVFPSPTKKNALRITRDDLKNIIASVKIPCVAIGGISMENMGELEKSGIAGVALVSAVFAAKDIEKTCGELKTKVKTLME